MNFALRVRNSFIFIIAMCDYVLKNFSVSPDTMETIRSHRKELAALYVEYHKYDIDDIGDLTLEYLHEVSPVTYEKLFMSRNDIELSLNCAGRNGEYSDLFQFLISDRFDIYIKTVVDLLNNKNDNDE